MLPCSWGSRQSARLAVKLAVRIWNELRGVSAPLEPDGPGYDALTSLLSAAPFQPIDVSPARRWKRRGTGFEQAPRFPTRGCTICDTLSEPTADKLGSMRS